MRSNIKTIIYSTLAVGILLATVFSVMQRAQRAREDQLGWDKLARVAAEESLATAIALVDQRLAGHPRDSLLYYYKARLYFDAGFANEALKEADLAISLGYSQEISHLLKAMVYGRIYGDYRRQRDLASKALTFDPTYDEAYLVRAEAHYVLGDYRSCAKDAASYESLSPLAAEGYETGLLCLELLGDYAGAEKYGLKVMELKPGSHAALWRLGRIDAARGRHKSAIDKFSEAIRISGGKPQYYLDRARSCAAEKDFSCYAWDYASAMAWQEVSDYATHYYLLGGAMHRVGELESALNAAEAAIKKEPSNPDFYELRGRVLADSGKPAAAKKDFLKMSALSPVKQSEADSLIRQLKQK